MIPSQGPLLPRLPWTRRVWLQRHLAMLGSLVVMIHPRPGRRLAHRRPRSSRALSLAQGAPPLDPSVVIDGMDVRELARRALEAATAAGATYADVRLTRHVQEGLSTTTLLGATEEFAVGVRARVQGGWGFAASPVWGAEEVVRLAREAVRQARANAPSAAPVEWVPIPVTTGHWTPPGIVDPFGISVEEKIDTLAAWAALPAARYRACSASAFVNFDRWERAVATTEGAYATQTLYCTAGSYTLTRQTITRDQTAENQGKAELSSLYATAAGWELFTEADIPGQLPALYEAADPRRVDPFDFHRRSKPGEIGRYDVVFDAKLMGALLQQTLGTATQLDRALGYEADAGLAGYDAIGTSYLGADPLALLGRHQATAPLVTVTANRSMPRGLGTVKWDDEGVEPETFPLVKAGVLVDYQTTREQATWLAPYYQKAGRPVRSHGCAGSESGLAVPIQQMPNLILEPGPHDVGFAELIADTPRGLAVVAEAQPLDGGDYILTDFQQGSGTAKNIRLCEIVNGRLGRPVTGLTCLFRSALFWKNVVALGGPKSVLQYAAHEKKGQPQQRGVYSVRAVPAKVTNVDFIDPARRV